MQILCTTAYWGPCSYYRAWAGSDKVWLEMHENYRRQTYRNRCLIYGANGIMPLSVPVRKGPQLKTPIGQVEIDYSEPWQRLHYKTLVSAYRRSPFFDYYIDDLKPCFEMRPETLPELNRTIMDTVALLTGLRVPLDTTTAWGRTTGGEAVEDLRERFNPRQRDMTLPGYEQVFGQKLGFQADLSILDALFNLGPDTLDYLNAKNN